MPFLRKRTSSHPSSSTPETTKSRSLGSYLNRKVRTSVTQPAKTRQAPVLHEPTVSHSHPTSTEQETQFLWEDINPPAGYLTSSNQSQRSTSTTSIPPYRRLSQVTQERTTPTTPSTTMLNHNPNQSPPSSNASLPGYNDVSGAVVVDTDGYPRFLTPQEEQDRKVALERAVRERMMGLPRRTDFSWEASANPVLPGYECASSAGAGAGAGAGERKGVST